MNINLWVRGHEGRIEPDFIKGPLYDGETVPITVYLEGVPGTATLHADDPRCPVGSWTIQLTQATPTSTPTATPTPTPTDTPTTEPTATPTEQPTETPVPDTPTPTPTTEPTTAKPCTGWVSVAVRRCGRPVRGVKVTLHWEGGQTFGQDQPFGEEVTDDTDGEVLFLFVPPGTYYAKAGGQQTTLFDVGCWTKEVDLTFPCGHQNPHRWL